MPPVVKGLRTYLVALARVVVFAPGYSALALLAWWVLVNSSSEGARLGLAIVLIPLFFVVLATCLQHRAAQARHRRAVLQPDDAAMAWVNAPLRPALLVREHELVAEGALDDPTLLAAHRAEHGCTGGVSPGAFNPDR